MSPAIVQVPGHCLGTMNRHAKLDGQLAVTLGIYFKGFSWMMTFSRSFFFFCSLMKPMSNDYQVVATLKDNQEQKEELANGQVQNPKRRKLITMT